MLPSVKGSHSPSVRTRPPVSTIRKSSLLTPCLGWVYTATISKLRTHNLDFVILHPIVVPLHPLTHLSPPDLERNGLCFQGMTTAGRQRTQNKGNAPSPSDMYLAPEMTVSTLRAHSLLGFPGAHQHNLPLRFLRAR